MAFLLLPVAAEEDKAERKEGEDEGVFLRFGDDQGCGRAGNHYPQTKASRLAYVPVHITSRKRSPAVKILIRGDERKVADGKGQSALPAPRNSDAIGVVQRRRTGHANAWHVGGCVVLQADVANGSSAKRGSDLRHAVSIGRQRIVSCRVVSGGSADGEELSAGGREGN